LVVKHPGGVLVVLLDRRPSTTSTCIRHAVGRVLGVLLALLDLALLAVPTGILGSGFVEEFQSRRKPERCPHCGEQIKQPRLHSVARGGAGGNLA
jgi:hypothetical protein